MVEKESEMRKANNLEDIAKKYSERGLFTTGEVKDILQVSQQTVIRAYDEGWFGKSRVPGSKHRRIGVGNLVNGLRDNWDDFDKQYPQRQLLHLMEVLELNPKDYKLDGFAGKEGIRFHVQEDICSTGKAADMMGVSQHTIIRCVDSGIIGGYRRPKSKFRWVPAGEIMIYAKDNDMPLLKSANELNSPELINYPGNLSKTGRRGVEWGKNDHVAYMTEGKEVFYRSKKNVHEFSIRGDEDYGLYIKFFDVKKDREIDSQERYPIMYLTLLGRARRREDGSILSRDQHLSRINALLKDGISLLTNFSLGLGARKGDILEVLGKVKNRFDKVYPSRSYRKIKGS